MERPIIHGTTIEEKLISADNALRRLMQRAHKSVYVKTPPIPTSIYLDHVEVGDTIVRMIMPFKSAFKRIVALIEDPKVRKATITINIITGNRKVEEHVEIGKGLNNLPFTGTMNTGDRAVITLSSVEGFSNDVPTFLLGLWIGFCVEVDESEMRTTDVPIPDDGM